MRALFNMQLDWELSGVLEKVEFLSFATLCLKTGCESVRALLLCNWDILCLLCSRRCDTFLKGPSLETFPFCVLNVETLFNEYMIYNNSLSVMLEKVWHFLKRSQSHLLLSAGSPFGQNRLEKASEFLLSSDSLLFYRPFMGHSRLALIYLAFMHMTRNRMRVAIESGKGMKVKVLK